MNQNLFSGKPSYHYRRRGSKPADAVIPPLHPLPSNARPLEDVKQEFLTKLQRQNASLLSSSLEEDDEELQVPDLSLMDPYMMGNISEIIHHSKIVFIF